MSLPQFSDIKVLSNVEISDAIIQAEKDLFNLRFKKATRQPFKSHEIKHTYTEHRESPHSDHKSKSMSTLEQQEIQFMQ